MVRFAFFVDGSNLFGSLKGMGVEVDDYQAFYGYLFRSAEQQWRQAVGGSQSPVGVLQRIYWYQVGSLDAWNLDDAQAQAYLKERFDENRQIKAGYMAQAGKLLSGKPQADVALKAWSLCFDEMKGWYENKKRILDGMKRFHHGVQSSTDLIDVLEIGHWKVDFFGHSCEEKGLDTRLAVDMIALEDNYDVAVVVSGDADSIPSIDLMKRRGKHVGAVEFVRGYPPEQKGRGFSSKIKLSADFVARVYEMELVSKKVAKKAEPASQV
ncbi:MAG: NYN domain-containing protein [Sinimarinibacterium flocculans]|uniref:NYN domain-containing protein n=1 Tax=Sinimarinibacterium flocculans TaxID=985250 RepID=UPI003C6B668C